jgi:hypothetical protein
MRIEQFIADRLAEDEQIANTAGTGKYARWAYVPDSERTDDPGAKFADGEIYQPDTRREIRCPNYSYYEFGLVTRDSEGITPSVEPNQAHHIARHDPARVLRQVTALRELLNVASDVDAMYSVAAEDAADGIRRTIAAIWSDHPDYQQEWADTVP